MISRTEAKKQRLWKRETGSSYFTGDYQNINDTSVSKLTATCRFMHGPLLGQR